MNNIIDYNNIISKIKSFRNSTNKKIEMPHYGFLLSGWNSPYKSRHMVDMIAGTGINIIKINNIVISDMASIQIMDGCKHIKSVFIPAELVRSVLMETGLYPLGVKELHNRSTVICYYYDSFECYDSEGEPKFSNERKILVNYDSDDNFSLYYEQEGFLKPSCENGCGFCANTAVNDRDKLFCLGLERYVDYDNIPDDCPLSERTPVEG